VRLAVLSPLSGASKQAPCVGRMPGQWRAMTTIRRIPIIANAVGPRLFVSKHPDGQDFVNVWADH